VLMLGFKGRYRDEKAPEREQLVTALGAQVAPLPIDQPIATQVGLHRRGTPGWLHTPLGSAIAAGLLLAATWWALDHLLGGLIATLVPDQV